jgi:hypothetical protein
LLFSAQIDPLEISTWSPKLKKSAGDFNLEPQVEKICWRFQLGAPSWKNRLEISTWSPKLEKSAGNFNLELQVGKTGWRFQLGAPS